MAPCEKKILCLAAICAARWFSRTYRVASLRAGPVGRISYNLYFDCKHVRYVTCDLINEYTFYVTILHCILCSKGKLWKISQICELNRYQIISSPICSWKCVVSCIKKLKFNSCGKSRKFPAQVWVPMTVDGYMYFLRVFFPGLFF